MRLEAKIDWIAVTLKKPEQPYQLMEIFGLVPANMVEADHGMLGYKKLEVCPLTKAKYLTDGKDDMGHHMILSGKSCDASALYCGPLEKVLVATLDKVDITRLDLALDIYEQKAFNKFKKAYQRNKIKGKFHQYSLTESKKNGVTNGGTLYCGSRQSQICIRIYDKASEQKLIGIDWTRVEIEIKKKRARPVIEEIDKTSLQNTIVSILSNYITLLEKPRQSNRGRDKIDPWWSELMSNANKIKLTEPRPYRTLDEIYQWLEYQAGPSLAKIWESGGDEAIMSLIKSGLDRL